MKTTTLWALVLAMAVGTAQGAVFIFDDFQDGDLTSNPTWVPEQAGWSVVPEPGNPGNNVLRLASTSSSRIHVNFTPYTYGANAPGPEWRVSLRYSADSGHGTNGSLHGVWLGTGATPEQYALWTGDNPSFFGTNNNVWRNNGNYGPGWGTVSDAVGVHWYEIEMEWEGSTNTLSGTWRDTQAPFTTLTSTWAAPVSFSNFNRLTLHGHGNGGKRWLFDDVLLEIVPEPSVGLLACFGAFGLLMRRRR